MKNVILIVVLFMPISSFAASIILNEYNAVDSDQMLGGNGYDPYWGSIMGNGGDWFEMVVINDHLDVRGWKLAIIENGIANKTFTLSNDTLWSNLRSGTIITISEDLVTDVSFNPFTINTGDWWINIQARDGVTNNYITNPSNFSVSKDNWQLTIRDAENNIIFGPAGEGVNPLSGVGKDEVFKLEADPSALINPMSNYKDGTSSTFGKPNKWSSGTITQDFTSLRTWIPEPMSLCLFSIGSILAIKRRKES